MNAFGLVSYIPLYHDNTIIASCVDHKFKEKNNKKKYIYIY